MTQPEKPSGDARHRNDRIDAALLDTLTRVLPAGLFITDSAGNCAFVNEAWCRMAGITPDEAAGTGWSGSLHPDDREAVAQRWAEVAAAGGTWDFEYRFIDGSGTVTWVHSVASPIRGPGGIEGWVGVNIDITDRRSEAARRHDVEERYRAITEAMSDTVWTMDMDLRTTWISPSVTATRGFTLEELQAIPLERNLTPESFRRAADLMARVLTPQRLADPTDNMATSVELEFYRKDGTTFWGEMTITLMRDTKGAPAQFVGVGRDITERRRMGDALSISESRLHAVIAAIPDIMFIIDDRGIIREYHTHSVEKLYVPPEAFLGKNFREIIPTGVIPEIDKALSALRETGHLQIAEYTLTIRQEARHFELRMVPLGDDLVLCIVRDITDEHHAIKALQESESQYRALVENNQDVIMRFDAAHRHLFVNGAVQNLVPLPPEAFIGKTHADLGFPPEICRFWEEQIDRVFSTGLPVENEFELETAAGTRVINWRLFPETDTGGGTATVITVARDITAHRQAERNYHAIFSTMLDGMAIHAMIFNDQGQPSDYRFLSVNPAFERLTGLLADEITGRTVREVIPGIEEHWIETYGRLVLTGEAIHFEQESRVMGKWFQVTAYRNAPGQFTTIFVDVTERHAAQERLDKELALNRALNEIARHLLEAPTAVAALADLVLDHARALTGSPHGFVSEIDPITGDNIAHTLTAMLNESRLIISPANRRIIFPQRPDGIYPGLLGQALNDGRPFFTNDPSHHPNAIGLPPGHVPLQRFIAVPARIGGVIVGEIALANADRDYRDDDLATVGRLADLYAIALGRIRDDERLRRTLDEKDTLLKEVHHRVKNNLQIISSLLSLQSGRVRHEDDLALFEDSQNRIYAMALVHEQLYHAPDLSAIDFGDYARSLTAYLTQHFTADAARIDFTVEAQSLSLPVDQAIPSAQILNELLTNAIKYAFPDGRRGAVTVRFTGSDGGGYRLVVSDDGAGMPPDLNPTDTRTLGMQIIQALTRQLGGTIAYTGGPGTTVTLEFS